MATRPAKVFATLSPAKERWVSLGAGTAKLPERLLLAHARGEVLFITGAGTSLSSGLPDFKRLVLNAYRDLDAAAHGVLTTSHTGFGGSTKLTDTQNAEVKRFHSGDYDVVLGMLERRLDGAALATGKVRQKIAELIRTVPSGTGYATPKPNSLHRALIRLADRGVATTIATTNFDRLLQAASPHRVSAHSLGAIPRPSTREDFAGVLHIHGSLSADIRHASEIVVTDRDFGEFYLRRRIVPDFVYDAARLFNLVLVGYRANDAPMRYLLNAVAADGSRFRDLKERFAFVPSGDPVDMVALEDWRGRGITPVPYNSAHEHRELSSTLSQWAALSAVNGSQRTVDTLVKRLVRTPRATTGDPERDLFDHLFRRGSRTERLRLSAMASAAGADIGWLIAMNSIASEPDYEAAP